MLCPRRLAIIALALLSPNLAWASPVCRFEVASYGKPPGAPATDVSSVVALDAVTMTAAAVGYGAAGGRSDEITVAEGRLYLVRPEGETATKTRHKAAAGEGAVMLQLAPVAGWGRAVTLEEVTSLDELGARLDTAVSRAGCAEGATLAFRIEGRAAAATWSLDTLPARRETITADQKVMIVGIYTTEAGRFAMPSGRRFHPHVVFPALDTAGHLRAVTLEAGASLRLQTR